jgi:hypothetical protein
MFFLVSAQSRISWVALCFPIWRMFFSPNGSDNVTYVRNVVSGRRGPGLACALFPPRRIQSQQVYPAVRADGIPLGPRSILVTQVTA